MALGILTTVASQYRRRFEDYERAHDGWYALSKGQKIHLLQTWVAELVRGEDRFGNFIHEKPPNRDMDADALEEHARIMQLRQGILYDGVAGRPAHTDL
jgi:hypothetical protein